MGFSRRTAPPTTSTRKCNAFLRHPQAVLITVFIASSNVVSWDEVGGFVISEVSLSLSMLFDGWLFEQEQLWIMLFSYLYLTVNQARQISSSKFIEFFFFWIFACIAGFADQKQEFRLPFVAPAPAQANHIVIFSRY